MNTEIFLIKFDPETGDRLETYPYDSDITPERYEEMIADGFEEVSEEDWNRLIGNFDGQPWVKDVVNGGYIPKPPYVPTLEEAQNRKIEALKQARDQEEVEPIDVDGALFDYDEKARDRINAAIIALEGGGEIAWTLADNTNKTVTANDLKAVIVAVAIRSNILHVKYRTLKEQVLAATSNEAVDAIEW